MSEFFDEPLTVNAVVIKMLESASWRDFEEFALPDGDTQAGVRLADALAKALRENRAAIVLGPGVVL